MRIVARLSQETLCYTADVYPLQRALRHLHHNYSPSDLRDTALGKDNPYYAPAVCVVAEAFNLTEEQVVRLVNKRKPTVRR